MYRYRVTRVLVADLEVEHEDDEIPDVVAHEMAAALGYEHMTEVDVMVEEL